MKEYKVVLVRQGLVDLHHRTDRKDLYKEVHRVVARDAEEAVAKAKALASWVNKQKELGDHQRVELFAIYELLPGGVSLVIPVAVRF